MWGITKNIVFPCCWISRVKILWVDDVSHSIFVGWGEVGEEGV